jgi:hypothetical protein
MSDKKRIYTVPVRYVFRGEFKIQAASKAQAEEYAYRNDISRFRVVMARRNPAIIH